MAELFVTPKEILDVNAVKIEHGLKVAFEKKYFYEKVLCLEGQALKAVFSQFDIVIEGTSKTEVFVRFDEKNKEVK